MQRGDVLAAADARRLRGGGAGRARPLRLRRPLGPAARRRARTAPTSWPGSRRSPGRTARSARSAPPTTAPPSTRWRSHGAPALAAMIPVDAMSNPGRLGMRHGGAFELRWLSWVLSLGNATGAGLTPDGRRTGPILDLDEVPTGRWLMADGVRGDARASPDLAAQLAMRRGRAGPSWRRTATARRARGAGRRHPRGGAEPAAARRRDARCATRRTTRPGWSRRSATATTTASGPTMGISVVDQLDGYQDAAGASTSPAPTTPGARRSPTSTSRR